LTTTNTKTPIDNDFMADDKVLPQWSFSQSNNSSLKLHRSFTWQYSRLFSKVTTSSFNSNYNNIKKFISTLYNPNCVHFIHIVYWFSLFHFTHQCNHWSTTLAKFCSILTLFFHIVDNILLCYNILSYYAYV
jgi:hypothetical protein